MNLSHEYNLAREHISLIDFTYLTSKAPFSTELPSMEDFDDPDADALAEEDDELADVPSIGERRRQAGAGRGGGRPYNNVETMLGSPM